MKKNEKFNKLKEQSKEMTVLFVEDEQEVSDAITDILENIFKTVLTAPNGQIGLETKLKNDDIDIIITDIAMPVKNGLDMIRDIRKLDEDISILIISAYNNPEYFMEMIKHGVDGYLLKPLEYQQLINTLQKATHKIALKKQNNQYKYNLELKVQEKTAQLKKRYYIDELTGLKNRYALLRDIKNFDANKLMLIDINKFSALNEVYGSNAGDDILKIISDKLSEILMDGCSLYRVSADQFVFLSYNNHKRSTCYEFIDTITDTLSGSNIFLTLDEEKIEINLSATISIAKDIDNNYLLECADTALHYAKNTNQPYVIYTKELEAKLNHQKRFNAIKLVKKALEDDMLVPFFQPIVKKEEVVYECLVRIIDRNNQVISPYIFIEEIKNTPYYTQLTKVMIEKSFIFFSDKSNSFSINLSFEDISNIHLIDYIKNMLDEYKLHNSLILEILESESINNFNLVKGFINDMKSLGVRIAIDDFGSGYSNFSYLLELEPDYIKIDGSIIKNIAVDDKSYTIAKTIVNFSKELGIRTIGEFICDEDILKKAEELNIDGKQGYFLGEPKATI
ncbi:MAG: EAL domain-containing protein [Campylobacterota bacterium]|nr:EAL domain-containing protein [Campylobacterota bacterium]